MIIPAASLGVQVQPVKVVPGVYFLGAGPSPAELQVNITTNINAADTTNADQLWFGGGLGLNLAGSGLTVGIWDGGDVRSTHQELIGRVIVIDGAGISDHSTHVAGTIGATGLSPSAHGMANLISIRSRDFNNDTNEMAADAGLIDLSNHSYGNIRGWTTQIDWGIGPVDTWYTDRSIDAVEDSGFGKYHSGAQALDQVLAADPALLSVWSAGNDRNDFYTDAGGFNDYVSFFSGDPGGIGWGGPGWYLVTNGGTTPAPPGDGNGGTGYDCLSGDQTAKNALVVGAIYDITADPYNSGHVSMTSFSSWGPVDDGRVKPDVVGNGNVLTSCLGTGDNVYGTMSGTSMSSPNVCGTAALLLEHYQALNVGASPTSATLKALLIQTAFDAGNAGPDYVYGWGVVDAAAGATFLDDSESASPNLHHLFESTYTGTPQDIVVISTGAEPLQATIVWTDPSPVVLPGSGLDDSTVVLVNDLDLTVVGPYGSTTYFPWTLDVANPSAPAVRSTRNDVDNVEQVLIDAPSAGKYTVRISHTGSPIAQQAYSLLLSDVTIADCNTNGIPDLEDPPSSRADLDGDGDVDVNDFLTFSTCFNGSLNPPKPACANPCADIDLDGDVDVTDFLTFSSCFNGSLNPPNCP